MNYAEFYARLYAPLRSRLGLEDSETLSAIVGFGMGGPLSFRTFDAGQSVTTYVSCELACYDSQVPSSFGRYELLCSSDDEHWVRAILTQIGRISFESAFDHGHTLDIDAWVGRDGAQPSLRGVLFLEECRTSIDDRQYGILRVVGITAPELEYARKSGAQALVNALERAGVHSDTLTRRASIF